MEFLRNILNGILMGVANVIPGVSGGTIAVVLGFYDRLMDCITINFKVIKKNLPFLIPLGLGVVIGVVGLSKLMEILFAKFPQQTYFAFIGIILGSLPAIFTKARLTSPKIKAVPWVGFIIAFAIMAFLALFNGDAESGSVLYRTLTPESFIACLIAMAIAVATMIIPGISGSMILIVMNMYQTIYFEVLNNFNIPLLIPSAIGGVIGLFGGAILIRYLLAHFNQLTYMIIVGLLVGSIFQLIVQANIVAFDLTLIVSIVIML
ncbi:MAG: DUF368 domain-containing protein, partial [Erysipelotrichaceae bacterium]|nr:DUF368 domain-containing protein [Erysipelotrichaceae bacterium]